MIVADSPDVYGYTIFCDDIRVEIGGKLTYVGAYQATMIVQGTFPLLLPKFAMHFVYMQRRPNVVPPTKIIVVTPGTTEENPAISIEIPEAAALQSISNSETIAGKIGTDTVYAAMQGPIMLTNFVIAEPGQIKVRAIRGDQFIRLGSLKVLQDPNFVPPDAPTN
jgi:hypothetical protein